MAALRAAVAREKTARSVFVAKERKLDGARSYRAMMDAEKTRIAEALRNEEAASEEEVIDLACRMIKRTSLIFPKAGWGTKKGVRLGEPLSGATAKFAESKSPRRKPRQAPPETGSGWFRLFKRMDDDGSGKITYGELEGLVRRDLEVSTTELPDRRLKAVWRALDADGSGYLTAGEFGHFMKRGEAHLQQLHPEQSWKQLLHRERRAQKEAVEEYLRNEMSGGAAADAFASVKAATASEVAEMASAMTRRMHSSTSAAPPRGSGCSSTWTATARAASRYGEYAIRTGRSELEIARAAGGPPAQDGVAEPRRRTHRLRPLNREFMQNPRRRGDTCPSTTWRKLHAKLTKNARIRGKCTRRRGRWRACGRRARATATTSRACSTGRWAMFKGNPTWYQLFHHLDTDRTGNITFAELLGLVKTRTDPKTQ